MLLLDPREFRDALLDPSAPEQFSVLTGTPLVVVQVSDSADALALKADWPLNAQLLPCVLVLLVADPALLAHLPDFADVVLTADPDAPRPYAPASQLAAIESVVTANPVAAATLALLLRSSAALPVAAGLIAESSTYSALQAGAEFQRWRAARPIRPAVGAGDDGDGSGGKGGCGEGEAGERIRVSRDGDLLRITLARPGRRNAVDARMRDALTEALGPALADPDCAVEITSLGPDFSAGGDLDEFGARPDPALAHLTRLSRSPAFLLHQLAARTTVRVHGFCLGAGIELPAFAGRVIADRGARFGLPEISLGLIPGAGGTVSLPRRIGRRRTAYLALSGERIDARQALAWGLVDALEPSPGRA